MYESREINKYTFYERVLLFRSAGHRLQMFIMASVHWKLGCAVKNNVIIHLKLFLFKIYIYKYIYAFCCLFSILSAK